MDSRDSSHSRERSAEKTEKTHKGSKKQKYVMPLPLTLDSGVKSQLFSPGYFFIGGACFSPVTTESEHGTLAGPELTL